MSSFEDQIIKIVFTVLEKMNNEEPKDTSQFIDEFLNDMKWNDEEYLKKYYKDIILEVWERRGEMKPKLWKKLLFRILS